MEIYRTLALFLMKLTGQVKACETSARHLRIGDRAVNELRWSVKFYSVTLEYLITTIWN